MFGPCWTFYKAVAWILQIRQCYKRQKSLKDNCRLKETEKKCHLNAIVILHWIWGQKKGKKKYKGHYQNNLGNLNYGLYIR